MSADMSTPASTSTSATHSSAAQEAVRAAIEGGQVAAFDPTGNDALDAVLACVESRAAHVDTGQIGDEHIAAARRVQPAGPEQAARALGIAVRPVDLGRGRDWWHSDTEPVAVRMDGQWCAVVPRAGRTTLTRPDGTSTPLDATTAATAEPRGWAVVPVLPDAPQRLRDARTLAWAGGGRRDVVTLALTGLVALVVGMLVPIFSGSIVSELVPTGELARILLLTVVLVLASALSALLVATQAIAAQRLTSRYALRISAATYERLFRLRTAFHREHLPGELAQRVAGVDVFRSGIASVVPALVSSLALLLASTLVLLRLSTPLAVAVLVIAGLVVLVGMASLPRLLRAARSAETTSLELSGLTFSLLGGIAKLRTAGAEQRMLDRWLFRFARQQQAVRDTGKVTVRLVLLAGLPTALVPIVLALVVTSGAATLTIGQFTTATAAAAQAAGAVAGLLPMVATVATLTPAVRALAPILSAPAEPRGSAANAPGVLSGAVRLDGVTFGYDADAPVLRDVTIDVAPGTMTAVVGPSGAGKSTVIRLLLGLERPDAGQVLFDGQALDTLDRSAVLAQVGVVPQDAALLPGSVLDNIVGMRAHVDEDAAWRAAERAGIANDIRAMPMGMRTVITEGGATFSGGQRQRLMLARALVDEPRLLILDEATSALDNQTQAKVAQAIATLGTTRIVVAHRLSTIQDADHIVVIDGGRIVEQGTFADLLAAGGMFTALASRQVV